jgi:hypothetical protein
MSHVERYHAPLRAAYQKIRSDFGFEPEEALELAVKCVNDTVGPDGLTPTLLVFGSIPRPARKVPADTQIQRVRAMDAARKAVTAEHARQKISFALRYIGPYGNERDDLKALERGDPVIVWRPKRKMWMPYTFIDLDGETVTVQNSSGRSIFRTNVVRPAPPKRPLQPQPQPTPATASTQNPELEPTPASAPAIATTASPFAEHTPSRTNDTRHEPLTEPPLTTELLDDLFGPSYADGINIAAFAAGVDADWTESRKAELMENGVFKIVKRSDLKGVRVFGSRFVDTIKGGKRKSRLVAQNFADFAAGAVPTRAPTISRAAERVCYHLLLQSLGTRPTYVGRKSGIHASRR